MSKCESKVSSNSFTEVHNIKNEGKRTHFVYNSSANPSQVNALLAKKFTKMHILHQENQNQSKQGCMKYEYC